VSVCGSNMPNPSLPYEYVLALRNQLNTLLLAREDFQSEEKKASIPTDYPIVLTTPDSVPFPAAAADSIHGLLNAADIQFVPNVHPVYVDATKRTVWFSNGDKKDFRLMVSHFPAKPAQPLVDSKLAQPKGFVAVNSRTCRTKLRNVYCIGDCADALLSPVSTEQLPKTASLYVNQAKTVVRDIANQIEREKNEEKRDWNMEEGEQMDGHVEFFMHATPAAAAHFDMQITWSDALNATVEWKYSDPTEDHLSNLRHGLDAMREGFFQGFAVPQVAEAPAEAAAPGDADAAANPAENGIVADGADAGAGDFNAALDGQEDFNLEQPVPDFDPDAAAVDPAAAPFADGPGEGEVVS